MILCPSCQHQELPGALFCSECGAQLIALDQRTTQSIQKMHSDRLDPTNMDDSVNSTDIPEMNPMNSVISLHLIESGKVINLTGRTEFTLGRVTEGQPILPDVDLSPYDAYSQGVSRLHSALKVINQRIVITDLGSSNGTRVNGQKIVPHVDYPLNHGDILALGKLKVQILINK
jgi:pSer/pThr/pTyr-binding forkhead associated (FHA) protein